MKVSESYFKSMCKYYHPGEIIYDFDDNNASFYIQQVETYINFPQYQERWGAHLVYSLSGTKHTNGVNTALLPEITTCRISQQL